MKLEVNALQQSIVMETVFAICCVAATALINRVGKFGIMCKYLIQNHFLCLRFILFFSHFISLHALHRNNAVPFRREKFSH